MENIERLEITTLVTKEKQEKAKIFFLKLGLTHKENQKAIVEDEDKFTSMYSHLVNACMYNMKDIRECHSIYKESYGGL